MAMCCKSNISLLDFLLFQFCELMTVVLTPGLSWGLNFNAHTQKILWESPQNPEIIHTRTLHVVYFCLMHISFYFCHVCHLYVVS